MRLVSWLAPPLITVFTGLVPRRRLLLLLMAAFMLGNVLSVVAATYEMLIVARFIAGLPHGAYFSVAALSAASMAPVTERGRAVAFKIGRAACRQIAAGDGAER